MGFFLLGIMALAVVLISVIAFLLGVVSLVNVASGESTTVVHEIATICYFILSVVALHCAVYITSRAARED